MRYKNRELPFWAWRKGVGNSISIHRFIKTKENNYFYDLEFTLNQYQRKLESNIIGTVGVANLRFRESNMRDFYELQTLSETQKQIMISTIFVVGIK